MIKFVRGNLFQSKVQTLTNTVNYVGIMGKGIALAFKERFPDMYEKYRVECERGVIQPGVLRLYTETKPWVLNFPTKRHWRSKSRIEDIELGLQSLRRNYQEWGINSLAMPALGCGHGGLDWKDVKPLIDAYLFDTELDIEVYEPGNGEMKNTNDDQDESIKPAYIQALFGNPIDLPKQKSARRKKGKASQ